MLKLDEANDEEWFTKGKTLGQMDKLQRSIDHFAEYIEKFPDSESVPNTWSYVALAQNILKKYSDAINSCEKAFKIPSDYWGLFEQKVRALIGLEKYPDAALLVHPESPQSVVKLAQDLGKSGCVGSTSQLLKASINFNNKVFIIATDAGILYQMQKASPDKIFIEAPTGGTGATCKSCARCPWMGMNDLGGILSCFDKADCEVESFSDELMFKAKVSLGKMVGFYSK